MVDCYISPGSKKTPEPSMKVNIIKFLEDSSKILSSINLHHWESTLIGMAHLIEFFQGCASSTACCTQED